MAKRRIQAWMRDKLNAHVAEHVNPAKELAALDKAYAKAAPEVFRAVAAKYPQRDMKVFAKYDAAAHDDCMRLSRPDGAVVEFSFKNKEDAPLVPRTGSCRSRIYLIDDATAALVELHADALKSFEDERKSRRNAYRALIDGSATVEDLTAVWPEAASIIPPNALPIALGPDQIALVQSDQAERAAA